MVQNIRCSSLTGRNSVKKVDFGTLAISNFRLQTKDNYLLHINTEGFCKVCLGNHFEPSSGLFGYLWLILRSLHDISRSISTTAVLDLPSGFQYIQGIGKRVVKSDLS